MNHNSPFFIMYQLLERDGRGKNGGWNDGGWSGIYISMYTCSVTSVMSDSLQTGYLWTVARQAPLSMVILQARILEWVAMPSSRGIFPMQGSNPGLSHCRWILAIQGSPRYSIEEQCGWEWKLLNTSGGQFSGSFKIFKL